MTMKTFTDSAVFNPGNYYTKAFIVYLRKMFSVNSDLGYTLYSESQNKEDSVSGLLICSKYLWETKYRTKKPCIVISRGNIIFGVNGTNGSAKFSGIIENGAKTEFKELLSMPIMIECLAESDLESEALASMALSFISMDTRSIRSAGIQIQGSPIQTQPQLYEKGNNSFSCSVMYNIQVSRSYSFKILGDEALQEIKASLNGNQILEL